MGAPSSGFLLWKTLGLSHWWALIQQNQLVWGPVCPCLATGILLLPTPSQVWQGHLTWLPQGREAAPRRAPRGAGVRGGSCGCPGRGGRSGGQAGAGAVPGAAAGPGGPAGLWLAGRTPPSLGSLQQRGNRGEEMSVHEARACPCLSQEAGTCQHTWHELWRVSTPHKAPLKPDFNLSSKNHDCFFVAHPFLQTGCGTCGYPRECRACRGDALGVSYAFMGGCQPHLCTDITPDQIVQ